MLRKLNIFIASIVLGWMFSSSAVAENTVDDFQSWGNITATGSLDFINPNLKNLKFWLEGQGRFGDNSTRFSQSLLRTGLGYALNDKTSIWLGYAWVPTSKPFALRRPFNENRIWQQLLWADDFSFGKLTSRTRFEQRFFDSDFPGSTSEDPAHRFRQFVKLAVPMPFVSPNVSFVAFEEIFINLTSDRVISRGFNQNRLFAGVAYKFNKIATGEIGYMNQIFNRPNSARPDQMQHILSVNLLLNF